MQISTEKVNKEGLKLIGFGSPIVDGVINYNSDPVLGEKIKNTFLYHMSENFPIEFYLQVLTSEHSSIFLGGSALNTIRSANYILNKTEIGNKALGFVGSIGSDSHGEFIKSGLLKEGVNFFAQQFQSQRSSTVIVLIENHERTFFSDLGGSEKITVDFFVNLYQEISKSKIFYADSYLIGKRFECYKYIFQQPYEETLLALGLASEYIIRDYFDYISEILPYLDLIFLNNEEVWMLKSKFGREELSDSKFIEFIGTNIEKINKNKRRVIINTRGTSDTLIYYMDYQTNMSEIFYVPILHVDEDKVIDLNGAGDAFSGGFLAGVLLNLNFKECAHLGNKLASEVIQLKGFQLPAFDKINLESEIFYPKKSLEDL
jgi:adenosine kinase